jgi:hypothetical protein
MTLDILVMLKDFVDSSPERVAGPVANGRKLGSRDSLNNLLDESFLDALYFELLP